MYLWEPVGPKLVKEALARAIKKAQNETRNEVLKRIGVYEGALTEVVETKLDAVFSDAEEVKEMKTMLNASVNIVKYITDQINTVYRYGADRRWMLAKSVEKDGAQIDYDVGATEAYARILNYAEADPTLDYANKMVGVVHDSILRYQYKNRGHSLFVMTRADCDVITDPEDTRVVKAIIYWTSNKDNPIAGSTVWPTDTRIVYTDAERIVEYDYTGNKVKSTEARPNPRENPFAEINRNRLAGGTKIFAPFIDYHDGYRPRTFWRDRLDDSLFNAQIWVCVWLTYLNHQLKRCTFRQPYIVGATLDGADQKMSPLYAWSATGSDLSVGMFDYQANLKATLDCLRGWLAMFAETRGLPANSFQVYPSKEPGVSIKLKRTSLKEYRNEQIKFCLSREFSLAEIIQYASNYYRDTDGYGGRKTDIIDGNLDPRLLSVTFADPPREEDPEETRKHWDWMIENDGKEFADYLVATEKDMTPEKAKARVKTIRAAKLQHAAELRTAQDYGDLPLRTSEGNEEQNNND